MKSAITVKTLATGMFIGVLSRHLYSWLADQLKRTDVLFDLVRLDTSANYIDVDLLIKNYSGSLRRFRAVKIVAFNQDKIVATGLINNDLFLLNDEQVLILDDISLLKTEKESTVTDLTFKLVANIDGDDTDIKAFQSNEYGAVFNEYHAKLIKEATDE